MLLISYMFMSAFPLGRVTGTAPPGGLGIPHGQQQFQIVLLAPHQNGTKQSLRLSHFTLALDELWAAFPWV